MAYRKIVIAFVSAVCSIAIMGCSMDRSWMDDFPHDAPSGGQTGIEAEESIAALPGVVSVDIPYKTENTSNIKGNTGREVEVVLADEYQVVDGPALVDFLVATLWSIREGFMPNAGLEISITANPADEFSIQQAAIDVGWKSPGPVQAVGEDGWSGVSVPIEPPDGAAYRELHVKNFERLGPWPGDVPNVPTSAIVPRPETG